MQISTITTVLELAFKRVRKLLMRVRHPLTSKARFFPPASREPSKNPSPIKQRFPEGKRSLIDFLASHVGENPTRNDMRSASKLSFEVIREIIDTLKDNQILDMDAKRFIVSFDSERADALLFPKD